MHFLKLRNLIAKFDYNRTNIITLLQLGDENYNFPHISINFWVLK